MYEQSLLIHCILDRKQRWNDIQQKFKEKISTNKRLKVDSMFNRPTFDAKTKYSLKQKLYHNAAESYSPNHKTNTFTSQLRSKVK